MFMWLITNLVGMCNLYFTTIFLHSSMSKVLASGTPSAQVRIPLPGPLLFHPSPTSIHNIVLVQKWSGGKKTMRRQINYPAAEDLTGAGARGPKIRFFSQKMSQCRKLSHSAQNIILHILINGEIIFAQNRRLSPILLPFRSYTLS